MALVTTCPHCGTSFRIVADQLKLRGGLVRCGSCLAVFSGLEKMQRLEDGDAAPAEAAGERGTSAAPGIASLQDAPMLRADPPSQVEHTGAWDDDGPLPGQTDRRGRLPALPGPGDEIPSFGMPAASAPVPGSMRAWTPPEQTPALTELTEQQPHEQPPEPPPELTPDPPPSAAVARHAPGSDSGKARSTDRESGRSPFALPRAERAAPVRADSRQAEPAWPIREDPLPKAERARPAPTDPHPLVPPSLGADAAANAYTAAGADTDTEVAIGDEEMAIDYFSTEARRRGFVGQHAALKLATAGLLVLALVVQVVLANRDWLAARFPALEPAISTVAAPFGLAIAPPRTLDALSIESFELQTDAPSELLAVSAILHNAARHTVRWPSIMLTLTDTQNRVLVRKAIDPADYLNSSADIALRPNSERPIRLALEARNLRPAGYSAVLFYR